MRPSVRQRPSSGQPTSAKKSLPQAEGPGRRGHPVRTDSRLDVAIAIRPALLRDVLTRLLDTVPDVRVVGYGESEDQIRKVIRKLRPGMLLFDYEAMGPNGESIISRLRRAAPKTRILVIARRSSEETIEQVLRAGASGLVGKETEFATLVQAIHAVAGGNSGPIAALPLGPWSA